MHEIVTVQVGQQANFLGTHFWNTQVSYAGNAMAGNLSPLTRKARSLTLHMAPTKSRQ